MMDSTDKQIKREGHRQAISDLQNFSKRYFSYMPLIAFTEIEIDLRGLITTFKDDTPMILIDPHKKSSTKSFKLHITEEIEVYYNHKRRITGSHYQSLFLLLLHEIGHCLYEKERFDPKNANPMTVRRSTQKFDPDDLIYKFIKEEQEVDLDKWHNEHLGDLLNHVYIERWSERQFRKHRKEIKFRTSGWEPNLFEGENLFANELFF